ncbi:sorting nexin-29-like [Anopheles funestus]|uniref:Sorting nexin-29 n=1 Tax=Anopheles funestus TaxID=62324 RepID=A0A182RHJ7_ANOFN|nr:sorting nexin-29-like [Anopheles funestus]XP_049297502.1 sorting nexin-29-like [Anopheles funestus]
MVGMSNFVLNSSTLENIVGVSRGASADQEPARDHERQVLVDELLATMRQCQQQYGSHVKLATEEDSVISKLCDVWERVLSHGLRTTTWIPFNILECLGPTEGRPPVERPCFWDFASNHLTRDERERFCNLQHVVTRRGRARALLRAFLNEHALERYVLMWLGDAELLETHYEPWAMLRQVEVQSLLPSVAAGLGTILFAIIIDRPELNRLVAGRAVLEPKPEPIIATRRPIGPARKVNAVQREILEDSVPRQLTPPNAPLRAVETKVKTPPNDSVNSGSMETPREEVPYTVTEAILGFRDELTLRNASTDWCTEEQPGTEPPTVEVAEDSMLNYSSASATTSSISTSGSSFFGEGRGTEEDTGSDVACRNRTRSGSLLYSEQVAMLSDERRGSTGDEKLKRRNQELEERCHLLESRVAALSLENHRLRMLTRTNRLSAAFFSFSIPKAIQRTSDSGRSRRPYHVYEIRITPSGVSGSTTGNESWCVYRRYNEFYRLHRRLQKQYPTVKTLDFPPKKKFGNMNADLVEQRRQRLQVYLNGLFVSALPEVLSCSTRVQLEQTFPFLTEHSVAAGVAGAT